jgi:hypothetical protein
VTLRLPHTLRTGRTLLAHELREQWALTALVLALGVALVLGLRTVMGTEAGALGKALPYLAPGLAALLAAFLGAEAWSRDAHTGLARVLAAAPLRGPVHSATRVVVLALATALLYSVLLALEPPAQDRFATWSMRTTTGVVAASVLVSALAALALRNGVAAALIGGALGTVTLWTATSLVVEPMHQSDAELLRYGLLVQLDVLRRPITVVLGVIALIAATALRGPAQRSMWRRSVRATLAAAVFLGPSLVTGANAVRALVHVPFDAQDANVRSAVPSPDGARVLVQVERQRSLPLQEGQLKRTTAWVVDTTTGARSCLPQGFVYHGDWHDSRHVVLQPTGASVPVTTSLIDVATCEIRPARHTETRPVSSSRVVEQLARGPHLEFTREHIVQLHDGRKAAPFRALAIAWSTQTPRRLFYVDEARVLCELSLADGSHRVLDHVQATGARPRVDLSPDGRWLRLSELRERAEQDGSAPYFLVRLVDVDAVHGHVVAEVEGYSMGWRRGPHPLLIGALPGVPHGSGRYALLGASGIVELPFQYEDRGLADLDGDRWLVTREGGRITVHAADGALLVTLREGHPGDPR